MDDHFRVRLGLEYVPLAQQKRAQLLIVVDFSVKNNPDRAVFIGKRLVTALEIDDGEPTEAECDWTGYVVPLVIRAAVRDRVRHRLYERGRDSLLTTKDQFSANAAHI